MPKQSNNIIDIEDQLINAFRPIEHLFQVMDAIRADDESHLFQANSEIGFALCSNFRCKLKEALQAIKVEQPNE